jgi:DNA-binding response OmpR family regulator
MKASAKRVLIAEDNPDVNKFLFWVLVNGGYEVVSASNGAKAMEFLSRVRFDAVLLDIVMPVMGGICLIEKIRKTDRFLPIIILSGHVDFLEAGRVKVWGIDRVLRKPAEPGELLAAVQQVTGLAG